jgi:hypothetical protein
MSASHKSFWLDRWWPLFLILLGIMLALIFASFKPAW